VRRVLDRLRPWLPGPDVTIAYPLRRPPWGGSNQFLLALRHELRTRGFTVGTEVAGRRTRACLLNADSFDPVRMRRMLPSGSRVVHRVDGPVGVYRGRDEEVDRRISQLNRDLAHVTVFQSRYSLEAHRELGLDFRDPIVIPNAPDPRIFHPPESRGPLSGRRIRLITTSWSDNPNKGGETYRWLDEHLDRERYELTFVGRNSTSFAHARVVPPVDSERVAELLRAHDVFVTASLHESCSNAVLEALACGLPVAYVDSGSNAELVGAAGLGFRGAEELPELVDVIAGDLAGFRAQIAIASLDEVANRYATAMGLA